MNGDPLIDICILQDQRRLERVYKGGKLVAGRLAPRRSELEVGYELAPDLDPMSDVHASHASADTPCCTTSSDELDNS